MSKLFLIQKQITNNIIEVLQSKNIKENDYVGYLVKYTAINKNRIKNILDVNAKKRMTLKELAIIAYALDVDIGVLFKNIV